MQSEAMRAHLRAADEARAEFDAQQQIIIMLLERLGGSVTIGLERLTTHKRGTILTCRDEDTGAVTISYSETARAA